MDETETQKVEMRRKGRASIAIILRYADWIDVVLMLMGALGAIGDGMSTNILLLFASRIMNSLGYSNNNQQQSSTKTYMAEVEKVDSYSLNSCFTFLHTVF